MVFTQTRIILKNQKYKNQWLITIGFGLFLISAALVWYQYHLFSNPPEATEKITIAAMPLSFTSYSVLLAFEKGFFRKQGLDVRLHFVPHGKASLKGVIDGHVDIGVSSETPFMHAVMNGANIITFATTVTAYKHLAIIARKTLGIRHIRDLVGKKIGVTKGSNGEYFKDFILQLNQIAPQTVTSIDLKPAQMMSALMAAEVDAVVTWNPTKYAIQKNLGTDAQVFDAAGLYAPFFLCSATKAYVKANPKNIEKVVAALQEASLFIRNNLAQSHDVVAEYIHINATLLKDLSATYLFSVSMDQALLITLENQVKWARETGYLNNTKWHNFLDHIYIDALEKIAPENITIIR